MIRYIHGSADSTDVDVHYVFDTIPTYQECKAFCDQERDIENRNIIVINNGVVTDTYKGSIDEVNNGLLATYHLHEQDYPLLITRCVERNKLIKYIKSIRGILSHISKSQYRSIVKHALKGSWSERLSTLRSIDFTSIQYDTLLNNMSGLDITKFMSFQIGLCLGLLTDTELYTKEDISNQFPILRQFLYREETQNLNDLQKMLIQLLDKLDEILYIDMPDNCVKFINSNRVFNLIKEQEII